MAHHLPAGHSDEVLFVPGLACLSGTLTPCGATAKYGVRQYESFPLDVALAPDILTTWAGSAAAVVTRAIAVMWAICLSVTTATGERRGHKPAWSIRS
jgi:hypothetical protein